MMRPQGGGSSTVTLGGESRASRSLTNTLVSAPYDTRSFLQRQRAHSGTTPHARGSSMSLSPGEPQTLSTPTTPQMPQMPMTPTSFISTLSLVPSQQHFSSSSATTLAAIPPTPTTPTF